MPPRGAAGAGSRRTTTSSARTSRERSAAKPLDPPAAMTPPPAVPYTPLEAELAANFAQAQKMTAGHRKLVVRTRKVFEQCVTGTGSFGSAVQKNGREGEKAFVRAFCRFLNRALVVKKGEVVGDRCLRYVDLFVKNLVEGTGNGKKKPQGQDAEGDTEMNEAEEEEEEETRDTSEKRAVLRLLNSLTKYMGSKEKAVRYRTTQLLTLLLSNSLLTFPFDYSAVSLKIFRIVHNGFEKRVLDKEAIVRVQAAIGLCRLLEMGVPSGDDEGNSDEEEESGEGIVEILIDSLQNDPSADVRRAILYNLNATTVNYPYLLERSRDVDAPTRRAVYTRLLPAMGDFRQLQISMREKLLRWGLNDRDLSVREAARKMFSYKWIEDAKGDILEVLERLDILNEPLEGGPKNLAMKAFWEQRKDVLNNIEFDKEFWENITPEGSFLARSFNEYCRNASPQEAKSLEVDERMPEVARLTDYLEHHIDKLVAATKGGFEEEQDQEFVVQQLLLIAQTMDYGDEIGRRKLFALLREKLAVLELSELVTKLIVEGLRKLSMGETDFCMLTLEVIAELHDTVAEDYEEGADESHHSTEGDDSEDDIQDTITVQPRSAQKPNGRPSTPAELPTSKKQKIKRESSGGDDDTMMDIDEEVSREEDEEDEDAEKVIKELMVNMKCLHIAQCMLENVDGWMKPNSHLVTMLNGLIVPAVRSHEAPVRERGLHCLGLSCLLDRQLSEQNLSLFCHCFNKGHDNLQVEALHIISDILLVHGSSLFEGAHCSVEERQMYRMLAKATKVDDDRDEVQATAVEVICKLMLAQVIKEEELLKVLVNCYFDPATEGNQTLRQILSYFLPVYCHSAASNTLSMARITVSSFHTLLAIRAAALDEDDSQEMVSPSSVAAQIMEWTDPRRTVASAGRAGVKEKVLDATPHAIIARDLLDRVTSNGCNKEERKLLINGFLGKCYLPKEAGKDLLQEVYEKVTDVIEANLVAEAAGRNILNKVEVAVGKVLAEIREEEGEQTVAPSGAEDNEQEDGEEEGEGEEEEEEGEEGEEEGTIVITKQEEEEDGGGMDMDTENERIPSVSGHDESD